LKIVQNFPKDTGFGILTKEFNKRLADVRRELSVRISLPTMEAIRGDQEVFWLFWETNKLPANSARLLGTYGYVWTPSKWLSDVLDSDGIQSQVVHLAIDPDKWTAKSQKDLTFRFLWVNEWIHRKGGDMMVEAFLDSFDERDNVELVIRPKYTNQQCPVRFPTAREVIASYPQGPKRKIRIVDKFLSPERLVELYQSCNCYVYPFRTQGASLTLLEAQACGLPSITTKYAGCLDYVVTDCTYFLEPEDFKPVTKMDFFSSYMSEDLGVEAVLSIKEMKELFRYCYEHPDEVASRGLRASEIVRHRYTWENLRKEAASATNPSWNRYPSPLSKPN
jgi:glycosyltransferase involved in cell wall biosynthesis